MGRIAGSILLWSALLSAAPTTFVRPGVVIKVMSAEIGADGTIKARVRLTDPKGGALDRAGVTAPGTVSVSLMAAYIPKGQTQYVAYTTRAQKSPINGRTEIQASADSGGVWTLTGEGEYLYTFATKAPAGFDRTVTHSIGAYGSRNLSEFDMGTQYDDDVYTFVPDGSKVTVVRDVVPTAACNACHHSMGFHGGSRRSVELCVMCHTPQTVDPDSGNTTDMAVFIHKIHAGSSLPSVRAGTKYRIIGHNQSVADYSEIVFPADTRRCTVCHASGATQANNMFKPSRAACGSCHDDVDFATGANHVDLPQLSDNMCANCHIPKGENEFDGSIVGSHVIPRLAPSLPGVTFQILAVDGVAAGQAPTVTFSLKDKAGNAVDIKNMSSLNLYLSGPNTDYSFYIREDVRKADGPGDGRYFWTFNRPLPADAAGSYTVSIEGRRDGKVMPGTRKEVSVRDVGTNKWMYFPLSGAVQARRQVVSTAKCNACHGVLSAHGDNRNQVEHCVVCHNANTLAGNVTVEFKAMVHRIHAGRDRAVPYKVDNTNFGEIGYPGKLQNCAACHVNGSENLPVKSTMLAVNDPSSPMSPLPGITAACTGCHATTAVFSHAKANTRDGVESCEVCHGSNADASVANVHKWQ